MRHFCSYGPVDCQDHFCIPRQALIAKGVEQLIGQPKKGGIILPFGHRVKRAKLG